MCGARPNFHPEPPAPPPPPNTPPYPPNAHSSWHARLPSLARYVHQNGPKAGPCTGSVDTALLRRCYYGAWGAIIVRFPLPLPRARRLAGTESQVLSTCAGPGQAQDRRPPPPSTEALCQPPPPPPPSTVLDKDAHQSGSPPVHRGRFDNNRDRARQWRGCSVRVKTGEAIAISFAHGQRTSIYVFPPMPGLTHTRTHYCETNGQQLSFRVSESSSVGHQTRQSMSDANRRLSAAQGERKRHILLPFTTVSSPRQPRRALSQGPVKDRHKCHLSHAHTHTHSECWGPTAPQSPGGQDSGRDSPTASQGAEGGACAHRPGVPTSCATQRLRSCACEKGDVFLWTGMPPDVFAGGHTASVASLPPRSGKVGRRTGTRRAGLRP